MNMSGNVPPSPPHTLLMIRRNKHTKIKYKAVQQNTKRTSLNTSGGCQPQCRPVHRGRPAHTQRGAQLPEVRPRTVRPTAPLEIKFRMLKAEVLEIILLYGCITSSPRACHYDMLHRAYHSFLTLCIGCRKSIRTDHLISCLNTLIETGSESIHAIMRRRRALFVGFVARMEDTRLTNECVMEGAGCVGDQEKEWMGCFLDDLRAFGIINDDQWTAAAQDEREWRKTAEQEVERFMVKYIAADNFRAGLRPAVVCPNVTGRAEKRVTQSKRVRAGLLAIID